MKTLLEKTQDAYNSGLLKPEDFNDVRNIRNIDDETLAYLDSLQPATEKAEEIDQFGGIVDEGQPQNVEPETDEFGGIVNDNTFDTGQDDTFIVTDAEVETSNLSIFGTPKLDLNPPTLQKQQFEAKRELLKQRKEEKSQLIEFSKQRFGTDVVDRWVGNPIDWTTVDDFQEWEQILPLGGLVQGAQYIELADISSDIASGKDVPNAKRKKLDAYIDKMLEMEIRGMSFGGKFDYYGSQMPAFVAEFIASGFGIGKLAQTGTVQSAKAGLKKKIKSDVANKVISGTAQVAGRTALMMPMNVKNYGNLQINNGLEITPEGQTFFKEAKYSPAKSALMAYLYTGSEVASEMSGVVALKYLRKKGITTKLKTTAATQLNKLPPKLVNGLMDAYKKLGSNKTINDLYTRAGWNGILIELGEERVADVLRETVNITLEDGYTIDDVLNGLKVSKEDLLLESSLIATMGGTKGLASFGMNVLISNGVAKDRAKKIVDGMSQSEIQALIEDKLPLDDTPIEAPFEGRGPSQITPTGKPSINQRLLEFWDNWQDGEVADIKKAKQKAVKVIQKEIKKIRKDKTKLLAVVNQAGGINETDFRQLVSNAFETEQEITDFIKEFNNKARRVTGGRNIVRTSSQGDGNTLAELFAKLKESSLIMQDNTTDTMNDAELAEYIAKRFTDSRVEFTGNVEEMADMRDFFREGYMDGVNKKHGAVSDFASVYDKNQRTKTHSTKNAYSYGYYLGFKDTNRIQMPLELKETQLQQILFKAINNPNDVFDDPAINEAIEKAQTQISQIDLTEDALLQEYMENLQNEDLQEFVEENDIEVPEGVTPQEHILEQGLLEQELTEEEMRALDAEIIEFTDSKYNNTPTMTDVQKAATDNNKKKPVVAETESIFNPHYYDWVDSLGSLIDLGKEAAKRGYKNAIDRYVRLYAGVTGMATHAIKFGTFEMDDNGNLQITGEGLQGILDLHDSRIISVEPDKNQRKKDLADYLIARRYYQDLDDMADVKVSEQQLLDSIKTLDALHAKYGEHLNTFDHTAKEIYEYQKRILSLLVSSGIMSQKDYDAMVDKHPNYIPFQRELDDAFGKNAGALFNVRLFDNANFRRAIKKIRGSDLQVKDPVQSIMQNTFRIVDLAWQNRLSQQIADLATVMPDYVEKHTQKLDVIEHKGEKIFRPSKDLPANAIIVYRDGKKEMYKVPDIVIKSLENMTAEQHGLLSFLFQTPTTVLRTGATITPEFMVKNGFRDIYSSIIYSMGKVTPIDAVRGIFARVGKTDVYQRWLASGGAFNSYMDMSDRGIQKIQAEVLGQEGKIKRYLKNPLRLPMDLSMGIEQSVRIGAFLSAKRNGAKDADAGMQARDITIDFARSGFRGKEANKYLAFFNAAIQGTDKLYRSFKERPMAMTLYGLGYITMPQLILTSYYLHFAPEEERNAYLNAPEWMRATMFVIPTEDGLVALPKPFTLGYIFGSAPEMAMIHAFTENRDTSLEIATEIIKGITSSSVPVQDVSSLMPPLVKVSAETIANHNFYTDESIYPEHLKDLPPEERHTKFTSDTAQAIGNKFGISPANVEHVVSGIAGGSGDYVLRAGDKLYEQFKKWNGEEIPDKPDRDYDMPVIRAFMKPFAEGNRSQAGMDFYDLHGEIVQTLNSLKDKKGEERRQYKEDNAILIKTAPYVKAKMKIARKINKRRNRIFESLVLRGDEKQQMLDDLNKQLTKHFMQANERLLRNIGEAE